MTLTRDPYPWPLPVTLTLDSYPWPATLTLDPYPYPWPLPLTLDPRFSNADLTPGFGNSRLWELFKGRLTSEKLMQLAIPHIAKILQTSRFIYKECKKKAGKQLWKNEFTELCERIFRIFPSLPKKIVLSLSPCLTSLISLVGDSTCRQLLPSSPGRWFLQFLDDRSAKKSLLEILIMHR